MGLFDKKSCDICGGKIGMLGNRKLDDGNCCKDCAKQLSPFFSERRKSTVSDIRAQLDYRERNKADVAAFRPTQTLGIVTKVYLDENAGKFAVSAAKRFGEDNPDIMDISQVTGCNIDVQESSKELKRKDSSGKEVSFIPPKFNYSYTFNVLIHVNNPWFSEIKFPLTKSVEIETAIPRGSAGSAEIGRKSNDYRQAEAMGNEIKTALMKARKGAGANPAVVAAAPNAAFKAAPGAAPDAAFKAAPVAANNSPNSARNCSTCGATCIPDAQGRCEYCGASM